jgi:DNA-binding transcriptional regulator YiaG
MESKGSSSAESLVIADKALLSEARDVFSRIGAQVQTATLDAVWGRTKHYFIFYVRNPLPDDQFSAILRRLKRIEKRHLLFYVPQLEMNLAFEIGMMVGRELGKPAKIASNLREVKQLLKSWDVLSAEPPSPKSALDIAEVRKRLGLTQNQMAAALNVTTRTLQNWEKQVGTSQMERRTRDLRELLYLMDDYVVAGEECSWLNTVHRAFKGKKPIELIREGKIRDLIVEFQRLREGQPL